LIELMFNCEATLR